MPEYDNNNNNNNDNNDNINKGRGGGKRTIGTFIIEFVGLVDDFGSEPLPSAKVTGYIWIHHLC